MSDVGREERREGRTQRKGENDGVMTGQQQQPQPPPCLYTQLQAN